MCRSLSTCSQVFRWLRPGRTTCQRNIAGPLPQTQLGQCPVRRRQRRKQKDSGFFATDASLSNRNCLRAKRSGSCVRSVQQPPSRPYHFSRVGATTARHASDGKDSTTLPRPSDGKKCSRQRAFQWLRDQDLILRGLQTSAPIRWGRADTPESASQCSICAPIFGLVAN